MSDSLIHNQYQNQELIQGRDRDSAGGSGGVGGAELRAMMSSKEAYQLLFQCGVDTVRAWAKTINIEDYKTPPSQSQLQLQLQRGETGFKGSDYY
jgi:hypothetical protein